MDDITSKDVEKALAAMEENKLILRYADSKTELIQIMDWFEFQAGLRIKNPSRYPPPEGWQDNIKLPPEQGRDNTGKYRRVNIETGEME